VNIRHILPRVNIHSKTAYEKKAGTHTT